jgi:hypothetical protein
MADEPSVCYVCGALITDRRGGELVRVAQESDLVWVHPGCKGSPLADPPTDDRE